MFQILFEKFADVLLPFIFGIAAWFVFNYTLLAPRIAIADLPEQYAHYHLDKDLPISIGKCIQSHIAYETLKADRFAISLYAASLKHYSKHLEMALIKAEQALDDICGISAEKQRQLTEQKKIIEQQRLKEEIARQEALAKKQRELKAKAQAQAQEQIKRQLNFLSDLFTGGK